MGYAADIAANGLEAIEAVERQRYDLVLMDMPDAGDGRARGDPRPSLARTPAEIRPWIVAMTANAMDGDRERCLEAGMNGYISKPIRVDELVAAVLGARVRQPRGLSVRTLHVFRAVFRNRDLRRVELAFVGFNAAECAVWIAMLVYAYGRGGATRQASSPCSSSCPRRCCAPFVALLADRYRPARVLAGGYFVQAAAHGR